MRRRPCVCVCVGVCVCVCVCACVCVFRYFDELLVDHATLVELHESRLLVCTAACHCACRDRTSCSIIGETAPECGLNNRLVVRRLQKDRETNAATNRSIQTDRKVFDAGDI